MTLPVSGIFIGVLPAVMAFTGIGAVVTIYHHVQATMFPWLPSLLFGAEALVMCGPVLSLLLALRTNAAYKRWLDCRIAWGVVINRCRDLTRQGGFGCKAARPPMLPGNGPSCSRTHGTRGPAASIPPLPSCQAWQTSSPRCFGPPSAAG